MKKQRKKILSSKTGKNIAKMSVILGLVIALCTNLFNPKQTYAATQSDIYLGKNVNYSSAVSGYKPYALKWASSPTWCYTNISTYENSNTPYLNLKANGTNKYAYASCSFSTNDRQKDSNGNYTSYAHYKDAFYYQSLDTGKGISTSYVSDPFVANGTRYGSRLLWLNYVTLVNVFCLVVKSALYVAVLSAIEPVPPLELYFTV